MALTDLGGRCNITPVSSLFLCGRINSKNRQDEHPVPSRSSIAASRTVVREDILICAGEPFRREGSKRLVLIGAAWRTPENGNRRALFGRNELLPLFLL